MPTVESAISSRLDADRRDLLDLSLRNPLLNYRPRARGLEIVGESPEQLYRALVRDGKRMTFLPAATPDPEAAPPDDLSATVKPVANTTDLKLQTALALDALQARLLGILYAARTALEEQGVNTLFLALGMLRWARPDDRARWLRAPLLLVPVALDRSDARERFRVRATDEEVGFNLSLAEYLKTEVDVTLPPLPDEDELDPARYFDQVAAAVEGREGWSVERDAVVLGFFSFGKFLMYRDLDEAHWPAEARPAAHPILRALLVDGFREPAATIGDDEPLDPHLDPATVHQVVDADSTQTLALLDVNQGRNLVIQGPPGTGKSQTIANLIAEAIGRGKTVLFVAEKMAALEVVKRRLDGASIGDACLELHSHKTQKRAVLDELRRTLGLGRPKLGPIDDDLKMLVSTRDRLNDYCEAVNTPIGDSGVTPYDAFGALLGLREPAVEALPAPLEIAGLPAWSRYDLKRRLTLVEELQDRMAIVGIPAEHPYWGTRRAVLLPTEGDRLRALLTAARSAASLLIESAAALSRFLRLPPAATRAEAETLIRAARRAAKAAQLQGADARSGDWLAHRAELEEMIDAGTKLAEIHAQHDATLLPDAWDRDLIDTRRDLNAHGRHWSRFVSPSYRRAQRTLAALCRGEPPHALDAQLALIDAVLEARRQRALIQKHQELGARLFEARWQGARSNWAALSGLAKSIVQLHLDIRARRLPPGILDFLAEGPAVESLEPLAGSVRSALVTHLDAVTRLLDFLEFDPVARFGESGGAFADRPFAEQERMLADWSERINDLQPLVAFNHLAGRCRAEELGAVVALAETWPGAGRQLVRVFRRHWLESLLRRAFHERPALAGFDGRSQEHVIRTFADFDRLALRHNRARLALMHWERLPRHEAGGQLGVLRREFEKKTRHLPLRQLMARSGHAIQAIKPVFMMSPLSVATYLAPGSLQFDLVVFDEASQVKPVDALGAILRGRQAVVVGDSRQLPPTSFFDRLTAGEDDGDDEETSSDVESILSLFASQGAPERMLRWHYRSRHESLIAVSNREFYDDRLVVFPSPDGARRDAGLIVRHLPGTTYDRGRTRANAGEAEAVAQAVMEHARTQLARPGGSRLTLGVAAFSVAQMESIQAAVETLRRAEPAAEPFFAVGQDEPFFIKNLENVQGDERDVIFISIGYGRAADGSLPMNFGPLNGQGGERRLNVLITRARVRCEVFTNLIAADIDLERGRARGVQALKTFLAYAEGGRLPARGSVAAPAPFEEAVGAALRASGVEVKPLAGALDLAVVDPDQAGRSLLGIECDGAAYHSARSARDRDRLRPQVLEALGWRLQRVWSTDWVRNPSGELDRLKAAIEQARVGAGEGTDARGERSAPALDRDDRETAPNPPGIPAYAVADLNGALAGLDLDAPPIDTLAAEVARIVAIEGPIHSEELARRVADAAGAKRVGSRLQGALGEAVARAEGLGTIARRGAFVWPAGMTAPPVRQRGALPASARRVELIAPEEVARAIETVVAHAFGIEPGAVPQAVARALGFPRLTDDLRAAVESGLESLIADGRLVRRGEHLQVPAGAERADG